MVDGLLTAVLLFVVGLLSIRLWDFHFDDAAILYRIADNLAEGHGWVFNLGEAINASTSVLWTLLLAVGTWLGGAAPPAAHLLHAFAWLGLAMLLYGFIRYWMFPIGAFLTSLLFVSDPILGVSTGLELHLLFLCALMAFQAERGDQPILLGISIGLIGLTRPDSLVLAVLLLLHRGLRIRGLPWRTILAALVVWIPWLLYSTFQLGSPLPNTLFAKMAQGSSGAWEATAPGALSHLPLFVRGLLQVFSDAYHPAFLVVGLPLTLAGFCWLLVLARPLGGLRSREEGQDSRGWLLALSLPIWGFLHLIAYSSLGVPAYHWYAGPIVLSIIFCLGVMLQLSLEGSVPLQRISGYLAVLAVLFGVGWNLYYYWILPVEPRIVAYRKVAAWIAEDTPEEWTLAAAEIGTLGYYSKRTVVDMGELLHRSDGLADGELDWWMRMRPDLILIYTPAWPLEASAESGLADSSYRLLKEFHFEDYQTLRLLERAIHDAAVGELTGLGPTANLNPQSHGSPGTPSCMRRTAGHFSSLIRF